MERLKKKWDEEFPEKTHYSAKCLRNNASRSKKERDGSENLQNQPQITEEPNMKGKIKWDNEQKIKLVLLEKQAMNGWIKFMERLKRALDECYPEFRHLTTQCLRDKARRFKIDKTIANLIWVHNKEEVT